MQTDVAFCPLFFPSPRSPIEPISPVLQFIDLCPLGLVQLCLQFCQSKGPYPLPFRCPIVERYFQVLCTSRHPHLSDDSVPTVDQSQLVVKERFHQSLQISEDDGNLDSPFALLAAFAVQQ